MYLKRLELHGFKSFAPRTVLEFSPGITAIVGPNGSGKSNIADGIRWVLGEQSMRTLRGKKSDDVIFAGGQGRATAQMAEVGLVLDNSAGWLPSEFSEVTAARRSFRNGDSEYLINGQRVRLKDVLLLLAQARIGHDSYTVIGQGLVDQALSQRAEERRGLFEDAAGIRQFQAQRTDAEQKLNLTQSNLSRLRDIIGEIEPRLAPLAEQARRAREYAGARGELTRTLSVWYRRQWQELHAARERAEDSEHELEQRIQKLQDALSVEDALTEDLRTQHDTLVAEVASLRRERGEALGRLQTVERDLAVARERLASIDRQESDLLAEQEQQDDALKVAQAHVGALESQVAGAEEQAERSAAALTTVERELHSAHQEQEREEARLRAAQRDVIQAQARLGAAQAELGRLQRQLGERNRVLAARNDAASHARRTLESAEARLAQRRQTFEDARATVEALVARRDQLAKEIADGQIAVEDARTQAADALRERRAIADRLALLEEWQRNLEGLSDGARAIMQAPEQARPPILGVVAQLIGAPSGMELAVETACGPLLQALVVATPADAWRAAQWLRDSGSGRAVFLWLDGAPAQSDRTDAPPDLPAPDGASLFGYARDLATCRPELRALLARILGTTYVVRDLAVAEQMWRGRELPAPIVTLDGEMLHPRGWLRGGHSTAAAEQGTARESSVLARERELRQLPAELDRLSAVIAELQAQHERARAAHAERIAAAEALRKELQRAEAQAQELAKAVAVLQREQERASSDLQLSDTVAEQLAAEVAGLEQEVAATAARVAEQEKVHRDAAEQFEQVQTEVDELLARNRGQQEELARSRTAVALQRQEIKVLSQRTEQMHAQAREIELNMARRASRLDALHQQRDTLVEAVTAHEASLTELRARTHELGQQLQVREQRQTELERQTHELERGQNAERQELIRLEGDYRRATVDAQRARDAIEALAVQIREELSGDDDKDPLALIIGPQADASAAQEDSLTQQELTPEEATKLRRQIDQLRARLRHLGGYDPEAPQAYEELKTRYDFLTSQMRDMEQASANLHAVILELDATMRRQFEETFHAVNARFQQHFTTLFSGGAARLELTAPRRSLSDDDEDDDQEARIPARGVGAGGVEVYVQIPGKKVQDLSLLSGGERAMVSVALLFALLETNPPPFCLLDEVDAALDEANVVRFCEILKTLAERTQFIVITHNRVTMTHAGAIYGISMGGDSVSRVISMRLAEAIAAG